MNFLLDILTRKKSFAEATGYKERIQDKSKQYEKQIETLKNKPPFSYINMKQGKGIKEVYEKVKNVVSNIFNRIKTIFVGVTGSPTLRKFLETYGNENIVKITVGREPLSSPIKQTLNLLSLGKLDISLKNLNYDKLFHLFLILKLSNGKSFHIEKNQRINVYEGGIRGETIDVPMKTPIKVIDFIDKTKKRMGPNFFPYDIRNNCQQFVDNLLTANGLNNATTHKFINQDVKEVFQSMPGYIEKISRGITNIAGVIDSLLYGDGKKKRRF